MAHELAPAVGPPPDVPHTPADARAEALLAQLTLDEKIQLVHGAGVCGIPIGVPPAGRGGAGFIPGVSRLGIPDLNSNDGSQAPTRTG